MFQGSFKGASCKIEECPKQDSRELQGYLKDVQRVLQGVLRKFRVCLENISSCFLGNLKKFSRLIQECFVLQFCSCMALIAATRVEGWLVYYVNW